jgi:hypothetical protein
MPYVSSYGGSGGRGGIAAAMRAGTAAAGALPAGLLPLEALVFHMSLNRH